MNWNNTADAQTPMTTITLTPGVPLRIQLEGTDGEFELHFDTAEHPQALVIKETAGLKGSILGAASAIMYHEAFGGSPFDADEAAVVDVDEAVVVQPVGHEFIDGEIRDKAVVTDLATGADVLLTKPHFAADVDGVRENIVVDPSKVVLNPAEPTTLELIADVATQVHADNELQDRERERAQLAARARVGTLPVPNPITNNIPEN